MPPVLCVLGSMLVHGCRAAHAEASMKLESPAFQDQGDIPSKFTCEGQDVSPALRWSGLPAKTKSLALVVDDPDAPDPKAPKKTWVHWVLFDIPASAAGLPEGGKPLPAGTREGINDWKRPGYGGPCPPVGSHRYFFKLYALDQKLELQSPSAAQLEAALEGDRVLAKTELIGTYEKAKKK